MKVLKLILGVLAGVWTIGVVVGAAPKLVSMDFSTRGLTEIAGGIAAILMCGLITFWLFESALKKHDPRPVSSDGDRTP